jgi:hypothetical protein
MMNAFRQWESEQREKAESYADPDMDEHIKEVLAGRQEATSYEIYDALRIDVNDRDQKMRNRVADALRRAGWRRKGKNDGTRTTWVWALSERDEIDEIQIINDETSSNFDLTKMLGSSNISLSLMHNFDGYARLTTVMALLQIIETPRRKSQSQIAVVMAAKALLSKDGRKSLMLVAGMLKRKVQELEQAALKRLKEHGPRVPDRATPMEDSETQGLRSATGAAEPDELEL